MKYRQISWLAMICCLLWLCTPLTVSAKLANGGQASSPGIKAYGCDLSFWNVGNDYSLIDFEKMKADGCDFAILRVGYEGTESRQNTLDAAFLTLYENAKAAGMDVGVYFYALATTYEGAVEDAQWCINLFETHHLSFEYPIYYDIEDPGNDADRPGHDALTPQEMTSLCLGWAETLEANGYYPGIYGMVNPLEAYTANYDMWYPHVAWVEGVPEFIPEEQDHSAICGMWQYSWKGSYDGAVGELDVNVAYKDYPTIMRKNGYNNMPVQWDTVPDVMPQAFGFLPNAYNADGEGIMVTYGNTDVTLTSNVNASWAWPSAYMSCYRLIDLTSTPCLTISKYGSSHFNVVLTYETDAGTVKTATLSDITAEAAGEYGAGTMTVQANIAKHLRTIGQYPANGVLRLCGLTYYIMGTNGNYTTFTQVAFTQAPYQEELTSSVYTIGDAYISRVDAGQTVAHFLSKLEDASGVAVYTANGDTLSDSDIVASGMRVVIEHEQAVVRSYTLCVTGDMNADGTISTVDARLTLHNVLSHKSLPEGQALCADYNHDGSINTADVREILLAAMKH